MPLTDNNCHKKNNDKEFHVEIAFAEKAYLEGYHDGDANKQIETRPWCVARQCYVSQLNVDCLVHDKEAED